MHLCIALYYNTHPFLQLIVIFVISIAVYGGLDMHGLDPGVTWTRLGVTAAAGDNSITLSEPVSWAVDSEIVITTTSYRAWDTETFKITAVSANNLTLTLNGSLAHLHIGKTFTTYNVNWTASVV